MYFERHNSTEIELCKMGIISVLCPDWINCAVLTPLSLLSNSAKASRCRNMISYKEVLKWMSADRTYLWKVRGAAALRVNRE